MLNEDTIYTAHSLGRYLYQSRYTLAEAVRHAQECEWTGCPWSADLASAVAYGWSRARKAFQEEEDRCYPDA